MTLAAQNRASRGAEDSLQAPSLLATGRRLATPHTTWTHPGRVPGNGQRLGGNERGGSLEFAAQEISGTARLQPQRPPALATRANPGQLYLAPASRPSPGARVMNWPLAEENRPMRRLLCTALHPAGSLLWTPSAISVSDGSAAMSVSGMREMSGWADQSDDQPTHVASPSPDEVPL
jgi:hypothetical protein